MGVTGMINGRKMGIGNAKLLEALQVENDALTLQAKAMHT